jgi:hypothetical protein
VRTESAAGAKREGRSSTPCPQRPQPVGLRRPGDRPSLLPASFALLRISVGPGVLHGFALHGCSPGPFLHRAAPTEPSESLDSLRIVGEGSRPDPRQAAFVDDERGWSRSSSCSKNRNSLRTPQPKGLAPERRLSESHATRLSPDVRRRDGEHRGCASPSGPTPPTSLAIDLRTDSD